MRTTAHFPGCIRHGARCALLFALAWLAASTAQAQAVEVEGFINTDAGQVWQLFTTEQGHRHGGAARAEVDFRIGGKLRTHHSADGHLQDDQATVLEVLAYDAPRMLAWRTLQAPAELAPAAALAQLWTVVYLARAGDMTQVRFVVQGADDNAGAQAAAQALADHYRQWLQRLAQDYWPQCALCKAEP